MRRLADGSHRADDKHDPSAAGVSPTGVLPLLVQKTGTHAAPRMAQTPTPRVQVSDRCCSPADDDSSPLSFSHTGPGRKTPDHAGSEGGGQLDPSDAALSQPHEVVLVLVRQPAPLLTYTVQSNPLLSHSSENGILSHMSYIHVPPPLHGRLRNHSAKSYSSLPRRLKKLESRLTAVLGTQNKSSLYVN
ncbi:hypothetical protein BC826DRAFT_482925 [Russula brevipes]|nr:hypothetical protein BC826DRAFT_482925 [Russula brevipes]